MSAKNYDEIIASVYTTGNKMDFGNSMIRGNGIPLDITEVYKSFDDAVVYAATSPVAYQGQLLAVTENGDTTAYVITPASQGKHSITVTEDESTVTKEYDVYIKKIGSTDLTGDGKTVAVADGVIKLANIPETIVKGMKPTLNGDGTLTWTAPADGEMSTEEIQEAVVDLQSSVGTLESDVATLKGTDETAGSVAHSIKTAIEALDVTDTEAESTYVTSVSQEDGKVKVTKGNVTIANVSGLADRLSTIDTNLGNHASDIATLQTTSATKNEVKAVSDLVGTLPESTTATTVVGYVDQKTAALAGAMHFKGVKTEIPADNTGFESGDVIIVNKKEYVFDGTTWAELGDEEIYAVKGEIKDADVAADAAIALSKVAGGTQLRTDVDANTAAIGEHATAIEGLEGDVEGINTKIGTVTEGKDVVTMISDAQTAATTAATEAANGYTDGKIADLNVSQYATTEALGSEATTRGEADEALSDRIKAIEDLGLSPDTYALKTEVEAEATTRDDADKAIEAKIGTVADGTTVVAMIGANTTKIGEVESTVGGHTTALNGINETIADHSTAIGDNTTAISEEVARAKAAEEALTTAVGTKQATLEAGEHTTIDGNKVNVTMATEVSTEDTGIATAAQIATYVGTIASRAGCTKLTEDDTLMTLLTQWNKLMEALGVSNS